MPYRALNKDVYLIGRKLVGRNLSNFRRIAHMKVRQNNVSPFKVHQFSSSPENFNHDFFAVH